MTRHGHRPAAAAPAASSLSVFTDDEIDDIHLATLEVLERTGVWVELDEALDVFADGGCLVDRETHVVRIPPPVVEEAIAVDAGELDVLRPRSGQRHPARARAASASPTSARA